MSREDERCGKLIRKAGTKVLTVDISLVFGSKKFFPKRVRYVMDAIIGHASQFTRDTQFLKKETV